MTDTTTLEAATTTVSAPRRSGSLTAMKLAELQGLASSMGISGTGKMRKGDLVEAYKLGEHLFRARIPENSFLNGKTIAEFREE